MADYGTAQEAFWAGDFGDDYSARNAGDQLLASNTHLFSTVLARTHGVRSVLELGANIGNNLRAIATLLPAAELSAVEINPVAAEALRSWGGATVHEGSLLDAAPDPVDLVFTKGVLIHVAPDALPRAYDALVRASRRYVLVAEYYNPAPVAVAYRGHDERLFKRDFAGELMARHPELELIDYGFGYRHDPVFPLDDITWFLMEKSGS